MDGVKHSYLYAGGKLLRETYGDYTLDFFYDSNGTPYALSYKQGNNDAVIYYYITNLQGDVMSIVDAQGATVASYQYDPYGNITSSSGDMAAINPLRYRGYYYDSDSGLYYLQSRYYDPKVGRFINADSYASTGQGIIGYNMFAYCRNNPTNRRDASGTSDEDATEEAKKQLGALLDEYATITESGFSIDIESKAEEWDKYIKQMGVQEAYDYMSEYLCQKYYDTYEREFLFSNDCVAYEIEYHVDAYMCMKGYSGYSRNITTYIFPSDYLIDHCKEINISTNDVYNLKQSTMFNYKYGIRNCYMYTENDPYSYIVYSWGVAHYERY